MWFGILKARRDRVIDRLEATFARFVRSADDRRLERLMGSKAVLRLFFGAIARRFDPSKAAGFEGELLYELRTGSGAVHHATITVHGDHAHAHLGGSDAPALTVKTGLADLLRFAVGQIDPGTALLAGRLDFEGDFELMTRLPEMFGEPASY